MFKVYVAPIAFIGDNTPTTHVEMDFTPETDPPVDAQRIVRHFVLYRGGWMVVDEDDRGQLLVEAFTDLIPAMLDAVKAHVESIEFAVFLNV